MDNKMNLDVDAVDKVPDVLRAAAEAFNASCIELQSAWQAKWPGVPWSIAARILDNAANQLETELRRRGQLQVPQRNTVKRRATNA